MTNEITVQGTQEFMGKEIPVIYGGFGEGQKVVLAKTIAEIHEMKVGNVNQRINDNRSRFKDGIDIIDLKIGYTSDVSLNLGFNQSQINASNNIYLLSERGYAKLIKIMDSDKAWEVHDKLVDEYFSMREWYTPKNIARIKVLDAKSDAQRTVAMNELEQICFEEGHEEGHEEGYKVGYTNGYIECSKANLSATQVVNMLNAKFNYCKKLTTTLLFDYLVYLEYGERKRVGHKDLFFANEELIEVLNEGLGRVTEVKMKHGTKHDFKFTKEFVEEVSMGFDKLNNYLGRNDNKKKRFN